MANSSITSPHTNSVKGAFLGTLAKRKAKRKITGFLFVRSGLETGHYERCGTPPWNMTIFFSNPYKIRYSFLVTTYPVFIPPESTSDIRTAVHTRDFRGILRETVKCLYFAPARMIATGATGKAKVVTEDLKM